MPFASTSSHAAIKQQLGIERLLLQMHDGNFPSDSEEDCGRGSPYSLGAERLYEFAARLGFDGIQLGPQGKTERGNPSPYDSTLFSRNPLNLPLGRYAASGRLATASLRVIQRSVLASRQPVPQTQIDDAYQIAVAEIVNNATDADWQAAREYLVANEAWLVPDALYVALSEEHNAAWWRLWQGTEQARFDQRLFAPAVGEESAAQRRVVELRRKYERHIAKYALVQWLLAEEHVALRTRLSQLGLALFADLQVGLAPPDAWAGQTLFLSAYRMGAPPSRTNPEGQPWGYAVFEPSQLGTLSEPGPALRFVQRRISKVLQECDGVRIDHPHGWIDPWVYRADDADPFHAVQQGARLFSSPEVKEHAQLAQWAIARAEQIDHSQAPYADARVRALEDSQVERYALLIDVIVQQLQKNGRPLQNIACEVLSTLPYPIQRVLERHCLGRFRVVQKLSLTNSTDVYRIENALEQDWIMLGTHDTLSVWSLANEWMKSPVAGQWGHYLASLLTPPNQRAMRAAELSQSAGNLVHGLCSAMFASRARYVSMFFPDLFGITERYNKPGIVDQANWRLRLPSDFEAFYQARVEAGEALDIDKCFDWANGFS